MTRDDTMAALSFHYQSLLLGQCLEFQGPWTVFTVLHCRELRKEKGLRVKAYGKMAQRMPKGKRVETLNYQVLGPCLFCSWRSSTCPVVPGPPHALPFPGRYCYTVYRKGGTHRSAKNKLEGQSGPHIVRGVGKMIAGRHLERQEQGELSLQQLTRG